jgi:hypothetical protein
MTKTIATYGCLLAVGLVGWASNVAVAEPIELNFGTMTHDGMPEQDVFFDSGGDEVRRLSVEEAKGMMDAMLFAAAGEPPPFQPMMAEPTDTYPKGMELGITLEQWLGASGKGTYECDGDRATVQASFENLVPNGVYTVWHFIDADPPTDLWQGLLWPLGARDGSQAKFEADADGKANFEATVEPCLQPSGTQSISGLAIAWHSDGETYGFSPGGMGVDSHAHLMTMLPHAPVMTTE